MQIVQQWFLNLPRQWGGLPFHWRWSIALLMGVALFAIGFGWWQHRRDDPHAHEWLFSGQSFLRRELALIESAFAAAKLNDYEIVDGRVRIPRRNRSEYVGAVIKGEALPAHLKIEQQSESAKSSLFETSRQREERRRLEQQRELAACVRSMKGIDDATVQIDEAVTGTGLRKQRRVTAIVIVSPSKKMPLHPQRIRSIQQLIAGAKVQLRPADVTVADLATGVSYGGDGADHPELDGWAEYALQRLERERHWSEKIHRVLRFIPGVEITATIESPGAAAQSGADSPDTEFRASAHPTEPPPASVSVSIGVPSSYYRQVWEHHHLAAENQHDQPTDEAIRTIEQETHDSARQAAAQLLPIEAGRTAASRVTVFSFADLSSQPVRSHESRPRLHVGTVLLLTVAMACGGLALYGILRDVRDMRPRKAQPSTTLKVVRDEQDATAIVSRTGQRAGNSVPSTQPQSNDSSTAIHEELTHIVRENPQAAAEMLRNWVDQAG